MSRSVTLDIDEDVASVLESRFAMDGMRLEKGIGHFLEQLTILFCEETGRLDKLTNLEVPRDPA